MKFLLKFAFIVILGPVAIMVLLFAASVNALFNMDEGLQALIGSDLQYHATEPRGEL